MTDASLAAPQSSPAYVFPNAMEVARERLTVLGEVFDPVSRAALARTGLAAGWSCWEVGAGEGGLARWVGQVVGPTGRVLATDLDPRLLPAGAGSPSLEVVRHDVVNDPPPEGGFDLVHTRLLLCHLPNPDAVLARLIGAVRPGGWIVVEDFDGLSLTPDREANPFETALVSQVAVRTLLAGRGVDLRIGRRLAGMFRAQGLVDVQAEGRVFMAQEGTTLARFQRLTFQQLEAPLLSSGLVDPATYRRDMAVLESRYLSPTPTLWSAIGRRAP
jgi:SAM-dependent methyltransferase